MRRRFSPIRHVAQNVVIYLCGTCAVMLIGTLTLIYWLGWGF